MNRKNASVMLMLLPLLAAGNCRKKPPETGVETGNETAGDNTLKVSTSIQTAAIQPAVVEPAQVVEATVIGAGFVDGATVTVGDKAIDKVTFVDETTLEVRLPPFSPGGYDVTVQNPDGQSSTLYQGLTVQEPRGDECHHIRVFFALDKADLIDEAKALLEAKLACLQGANLAISIEGHADERGTTDYNIALGQRRADTLQTFLSTRGVAPSRITTLSYGEEKPLSEGHDEAAWSLNRRGEVKLTQ